ncbi:endo-1,3-alpha-glucanase family glycosylhydrolase [Reichenbachiella sp.]|uniref:endo-1,3-alpha-glucanase family glycosylhydrolase n=1 Tax=Reichenbachiella sp. TaxID=2184521 RepID=UPI003BAF7576
MKVYNCIGFVFLAFWVISCQSKQNEIVKGVPEVLIHYMSWYGDEGAGEDSLRHWQFGHANTPTIGLYDSHNKSTLYYHLLLAKSAGIDGVVVNVKDEYDRMGMERVLLAIKELDSLNEGAFDFKFAVSFDDQGFDLEAPLDTTLFKLTQFKANYIDGNKHYLRYGNKPVFYSFDYPNKFITAKGLDQSLDSVFGKDQSILIWNTFGEGENTQDYVDAFYPWVQPGGEWMEDGSNWGKPYLEYFYKQINQFENKPYSFSGGGVWPGFDDRKNTSWGGDRLISRSGGATYDSTWNYIHKYQGEVPMKYVMVETWNDWNEGTEIEPSVEYGFQNLVQTESNILKLKGEERSGDTFKYEVAVSIYKVLKLMENKTEMDDKSVNQAIKQFLNREYEEANKIIQEAL